MRSHDLEPQIAEKIRKKEIRQRP